MIGKLLREQTDTKLRNHINDREVIIEYIPKRTPINDRKVNTKENPYKIGKLIREHIPKRNRIAEES